MEKENKQSSDKFKLRAQLNKTNLVIGRLEGRVSGLKRQLKKNKGLVSAKALLSADKGVSC